MFPRSTFWRNGWLGRYTYNPLLLCKGHDEACRKPKGLHFIYPYLNQPFTFPRFANSDRWFAAPNGAAA